MRFLLFVVALLLTASQSFGAFIITVDTQTFNQDSGIQNLDVFASTDAGDAATAIQVDFFISPGQFPSPTAGTFGQEGMIGNPAGPATNIDSGTFNRQDPLLNVATLSVAFTASQTFPATSTPGVLGSFSIDTSAFAPGTYTITPFDGAASGSPTFEFNSGSFTISAVPEPATLGLIGLGACGVAAGVRRRWNKKQPA